MRPGPDGGKCGQIRGHRGARGRLRSSGHGHGEGRAEGRRLRRREDHRLASEGRTGLEDRLGEVERPSRPVSARRGTYSLVARDSDSGELGVAVQSHWFSVGSVVSWAEPGVGAVATQSIAEPAYGPRLLDPRRCAGRPSGPRLLERLRGGQARGEALQELLAADGKARFRQVAVVDGTG